MKGWTTVLTLLMVSLAQAAFWRRTGGGSWMKTWVRRTDESKGREYDFATVGDFIKNSDKSSVFSPICSELNVLLQACAGEYGPGVKEQATDYINKLMDVLGKMDTEKLKASNRIYIPEDREDMCPKGGSGYSLRRYTREDGNLLFTEHKKWVETESHKKLESSLKAEDFMNVPLNRIYASLVYFKDQWHNKFLREYTRDGKFHLEDGSTVLRRFMNKEDDFKHRRYGGEDSGFDMVAVPYAGKDAIGRFTRYMVYLVPRRTDVSLVEVWENFHNSAIDGIGKLLHSCFEREVDLTVPRIENLRSNLDLKDILRNTYGKGPAPETDSKMAACIDVDEEGTEAVALTETCCTDGIGYSQTLRIRADRPHIAFVYDMTVNRVLFVVKDMGCADAKERSN